MKGQVFVAGAFMIAIVIILFGIGFAPIGFESPHRNYIADNIAAEYSYALDANSVRQFTEHVGDMENFEAIYTKIVRKEGGFDVVLGNYLGDDVAIAIEATNSDPAKDSATVNDNSELAFGFASSGTSDVSITYSSPGRTWRESFTTAPGDGDKMLYDFALVDSNFEIRRKGLVES